MLHVHPVSPTSSQDTNATEGREEVLLAISRELRESPEGYAATVAQEQRRLSVGPTPLPQWLRV